MSDVKDKDKKGTTPELKRGRGRPPKPFDSGMSNLDDISQLDFVPRDIAAEQADASGAAGGPAQTQKDKTGRNRPLKGK